MIISRGDEIATPLEDSSVTTGRLAGWGLMAALACTGCSSAYVGNRCRDAREMVDFGVTVSRKPYFALLPMDYSNATPLGYSRIEGRFHGLFRSRWGSWDLKDSTWGILLSGRQTLQYGDFDLADPTQMSPRRLTELKATGKPLPTEAPRYDIGMIPALSGGDLPSYPSPYS